MKNYKEIILTNEEYLQSLLKDIKHAESTIDLETYTYENDLVGKKVSDALCEAAKRNVKVRVLVDGIGSPTWGSKMTTKLEKAGVKTKIFHPLPWKILHWSRSTHPPKFFLLKFLFLIAKINSRNHRKTTIIDKKIIYIGGANINNYLLPNNDTGNTWRDTTVKLVGVNTEELELAFEKIWFPITSKLRLPKFFNSNASNQIFRLNNSWRRRHFFYKLLLQRISNCKKRIWVTNAYFVPDSYLLKKLIKASQRGVDVRILLPGKSDVILVALASATFYKTLIDNGVLIYEYASAILHAKILILDDWYSIGSTNLNYRSFKHDLEVEVEIQTKAAKKIIEKQFLEDIKHSRQIKAKDLKQQPFYKKILGWLVLLMRYWI